MSAEPSFGSLEARSADTGIPLGSLLSQAIHYYVADGSAGRAAWRYPRFRCGRVTGAAVDGSPRVDSSTWETFTAAAAEQRVSVEQLLEHAVLYFVADLDSGRLADRIVDGLHRAPTRLRGS